MTPGLASFPRRALRLLAFGLALACFVGSVPRLAAAPIAPRELALPADLAAPGTRALLLIPAAAEGTESAAERARPRLVLLASPLEEIRAGQIARLWADSGHRVLCVLWPLSRLAPPATEFARLDSENHEALLRLEHAAFGPTASAAPDPARLAVLGDAAPLLARWALAGRLGPRDCLVLAPSARPVAPAASDATASDSEGPRPAAESGRWFRLAPPGDNPPALTPAEEQLGLAGWRIDIRPLSPLARAARNSSPATLRASREWADAFARAEGAPPALRPPGPLPSVHRRVQWALALGGAVLLAASAGLLLRSRATPGGVRRGVGLLGALAALGLSLLLYLQHGLLPLFPAGLLQRLGLAPRELAAHLEGPENASWAAAPFIDLDDHLRLRRLAASSAPGEKGNTQAAAFAHHASLDPRWRREFWDLFSPWLRVEPDPEARAALVYDLLRAEVALLPAAAPSSPAASDPLASWRSRRQSPEQFTATLALALAACGLPAEMPLPEAR